MIAKTSTSTAGVSILLFGWSLGLAACDSPDVEGRSRVVVAEASSSVIDDRSLDQEEFHPPAASDDEENPEPAASGLDHEEPDVAGLRWLDAKHATFEVPHVDAGEWTLEVRVHGGKHKSRWVQGPYDVEEVADVGLRLEAPRGVFDAAAPRRPLRVMARLVLTDIDGNRRGAMALPALVMQQRGDEIRYALQATLPLEIERDGDETFASADLPKSL